MNKPRVYVEYYRKDDPFCDPLRYLRGLGFLCGDTIYPVPPLSTGGAVIAHVELGGDTFETRADCSIQDTFCYAIGRTIACWRLCMLLAAVGREGDVLWPGQVA